MSHLLQSLARSFTPPRYSLLVIICIAVSLSLTLPIPPLSPVVVWAAAAQIKSITPSCAAVGESVRLNGNGLGATNLQVLVGDMPASVNAATGNHATFVVPAGVTPGVVIVTAVNPGEHSGSIAFRVKNTIEICGDAVDDNCNGQIDDPECTTVNHPPVSNSGPDQTQPVGTTAQLDGAASNDPDGDGLTFQWTLTTKPTGSTATLSGPTTAVPTFLIDKAGTYHVQLVVNDGSLASSADSVIISTSNSAPVAHAGEGQSGQIGNTLTLDGGSSSDIDGDALTYHWNLLSHPTGSTATLTNPTTVNPALTLDQIGNYVVQLTVNDGTLNSAPDTVTLSTLNSIPVAKAGSDQSATVGAVVHLDGSQSSDADGNPLSYQWGLTTRPTGSGATLSDSAAVQPSFQIDKPGTYVAQLIVNDGFASSAPALVTISTLNTKPLAQAGADQSGQLGQTITLDGSASSDVDGDSLTYQWNLLSKPIGSGATLATPTSSTPSFTIDRAGTYIAQLLVHDGHTTSTPDTITISTANTRPVAEAGADQSGTVGATVTLDSSGSSDVDGDPLTSWWALTTKPAGSPATVSDPTALHPTFTLDRPGTYAAQLTVSDGELDSAPDSVTISTLNVKPVADAGSDQYRRVGDVVTLDGFQSSDPDGDALTYQWSVITKPTGSTVNLQSPTAPRPSFILDRTGTYTLQLLVNDGQMDSEPDTVIVTTENTKPAANAGPDRSGPVGTPILLDGSASYDADGDTLTYLWTLNVPLGEPVTLTTPTSVQPTLVSSVAKLYLAQLIVSDGTMSSDPATVFIRVGAGSTPPPNQPPLANAGPDQTIRLGQLLQLDGSSSFDPNGDPLLYRWSLVSAPAGPAAFMQANGARLTFQAQTGGDYVIQLVVNDGTVDSPPDQVTITVSNTANAIPIANAGPDQTVTPDTTVQLTGDASSDGDGDTLTYNWRLTLKPTGSTAALQSATDTTPTFVADVIGTYIAQLIVSDGFSASTPDTVTITATASADTTPPPAADLSKMTIGYVINGQVTVTGLIGAVEGSTRVTITNHRTGATVTVPANATGSFTARLAAQTGDGLAIVVTDAAGNGSPVVQGQVGTFSGDPVDAPFRAAWDGMNTALLAGDKATALTYLTTGAQIKYGPVFDALLPHIADIIRSYSPLLRFIVGTDIAEYAINRTINGEKRLFLISFVKDSSGAWRIDGM